MNFLQEKFLDNTILNWLIVAGIILFVIFFKRLLSRYIASFSYLLINRAWKMITLKQFTDLFLQPLKWFLLITITVIAFNKLTYPAAWHFTIYKIPFELIIEKTVLGIFIYSFFRLVLSAVDFIALILSEKASLTKDKSDDQLVVFFRDFFKVILSIVAVLLILKAAFNQNIGNLLTGLSIVGAALALSARESLENLIASFIIFFDKPFYVGDTLKVNAVIGKVERIGLRSTRIRTADKTLVTVPNKQMVDSVVDNYSMRTERRAEIKLEFSEKTSLSMVKNFLSKTKEIMDSQQQHIIDFSVFLTDYSKSGTTITLEYFTPAFTMAEFNRLKQEIHMEMMQLMEKEKMEFGSATSINIITPEQEISKTRPIL